MKFYKLTNKYEICIRNRSDLPYYKFWFRRSSVVGKQSKPLGYTIGIYLYFWHISIDVSLF